MQIVKRVQPPSGLSRALFRAPTHLYQLGLGWLFGKRILLLNHTGRVTGKQRQAILEVVDNDPRDGSFVVASGWGTTADWYRNVLHTPEVSFQTGTRAIPATALPLSAEEGVEIFARYAARHRAVARYLLPRLMGFSVDGSEADFREVGRRMPFVRLVTRD
jgi:deazaflavin-dependent oxidoreductase (nitroreductase family)